MQQRRRPRRIQKFSSTFSKVKFSSTFFKRWRVPRAAPLAAIRRWRNAPCFRRIWGSGGLCKRKAPRTFPVSLTQRVGASPWGRWRKAPVGALPGRWGFFSWGGPASPFCQCLPFQGRWPEAPTQPQPPLLGEVARRAGEVVLQEGPCGRDPSAAWRRQLPLQGEPKRGPYLSISRLPPGGDAGSRPGRRPPFLRGQEREERIRLGGLRRPPKNPREPLVPDLHTLAPLMRSVAQD